MRFLRNAIYTDSEAGRLLTLSLKYTQLEAGIYEDLLANPTIDVPYISPTWLMSLRLFAANHSIKIHITNTLKIRLNGGPDRCIMDPTKLKSYTPAQQRDINLVRLYLRVITLADISEPSGQDIALWALTGVRLESDDAVSSLIWPYQSTPTQSQRRLWRRYLSSHYIRYGTKWRASLGKIQPLSSRTASLENKSFDEFAPHNGRTPSNDNCDSLRSYIKRLPQWHQRLLQNHTQVADDIQIWRAFRSRRRLTIASDGGLRKGTGTFGWKIVMITHTGQPITLFEGSGPVDGPRDIINSTRCELGGLVAPLLLCSSLAAYWGLRHRCKYRWVTDSKAAISKVEFITRPSQRRSKAPEDVDYMTAIRELNRSLGPRMKLQWVKGHQDERQDYDNLPLDAKLNVDADALLATDHLMGKTHLPSQQTPHTPWLKITIEINGRRYPSQIDAQLRYHINGSYLKNYLHRHEISGLKPLGNQSICTVLAGIFVILHH
jgi:ribonuclease HI